MAAGWERRRSDVWASTRLVSERLVELLAPADDASLLEVAAGPGDTGFLAARRLGPDGRLLSTDAIPGMVESARRRAHELGLDNVEFVVADASALPFPDASFDGALCRFGVMLVPDCDRAARELGRVVRPGGRIAVAVWAEPERNPWMTATGRAALALGLAEPADPDAPGPFRLASSGRLRDVLERAGLRVDVEEEVSVTWLAASLDDWWQIALDTSRALSTLAERLSEAELAAVRAGAAAQLSAYVSDDGALAVPGVARVALAGRV